MARKLGTAPGSRAAFPMRTHLAEVHMRKKAFYPPGFMSLRDAVRRVAEARGEPISEDDCERLDRYWSAERKAREQSYAHGLVDRVVLEIIQDETTQPIKSRYQRAADRFESMAWAEPSLTAIDGAAGLQQLSSFWGKSVAGAMLENGMDTWEDSFGDPQGPILVRESTLNALLRPDEPLNEPPSFIPPFIAYTLRGVKELRISEGSRTPKDQIEHWLRQNWPKEAWGRPSDKLIDTMATMMRQPEYRRGGLIPSKRR
jgi:hypothetical protein